MGDTAVEVRLVISLFALQDMEKDEEGDQGSGSGMPEPETLKPTPESTLPPCSPPLLPPPPPVASDTGTFLNQIELGRTVSDGIATDPCYFLFTMGRLFSRNEFPFHRMTDEVAGLVS